MKINKLKYLLGWILILKIIKELCQFFSLFFSGRKWKIIETFSNYFEEFSFLERMWNFSSILYSSVNINKLDRAQHWITGTNMKENYNWKNERKKPFSLLYYIFKKTYSFPLVIITLGIFSNEGCLESMFICEFISLQIT